jgi:hypothetical protein
MQDEGERDNFELRKRYFRWTGTEPLTCSGCGETITRLERTTHLKAHTSSATKQLIERVSPPPAGDFYIFCVLENFTIDGLGPKHPTVIEALASWLRYLKLGLP